jgi:AcrR family transcriptional regulator
MTQKEIVVREAAKMFLSEGIKSVRMDDIARGLSVSKRTLYELFGDKEELIYEAICHYVEEAHTRRSLILQDVDNELEAMLVSLRDMIVRAPEVARVRRNLERFYPKVNTRLEESGMMRSKSELREWLAASIERGYLTPTANSDLVVDVLHNCVQGMLVVEYSDDNRSANVVSRVACSVLIFIRGLCTPEGLAVVDRCFSTYYNNICVSETL